MTEDRDTLVTLPSETIVTMAKVRISELREWYKSVSAHRADKYIEILTEIRNTWWKRLLFGPIGGFETLNRAEVLDLLECTYGSDLPAGCKDCTLLWESGQVQSKTKRLALLQSAASRSEQVYLSLSDYKLLTGGK